MDRRALLALGAGAPLAFAGASAAAACSIAVPSPASHAARVPLIQQLFEHWFARNEGGYLAPFYWRQDGPPKIGVLLSLARANEDTTPIDLFEAMFTETERFKSVMAVTVVSSQAFAAVGEHMVGGIGADCSNMPVLHVFHIGFAQERLSRIALIESQTFAGHGPVASWTASA